MRMVPRSESNIKNNHLKSDDEGLSDIWMCPEECPRPFMDPNHVYF